MKKIVLLFACVPFLLAMQCDPEPDPCGNYIEFEKSNLITIDNPQSTYLVGDIVWLSSIVDRNQINSNTGSSIDLFVSDEKLAYYVDLRKDSNYNGYYQLLLNENTTVVEYGELNWNNFILTSDGSVDELI